MSIKEQATKSVFWSAVERFSVQGIQFLLTIVIARIYGAQNETYIEGWEKKTSKLLIYKRLCKI